MHVAWAVITNTCACSNMSYHNNKNIVWAHSTSYRNANTSNSLIWPIATTKTQFECININRLCECHGPFYYHYKYQRNAVKTPVRSHCKSVYRILGLLLRGRRSSTVIWMVLIGAPTRAVAGCMVVCSVVCCMVVLYLRPTACLHHYVLCDAEHITRKRCDARPEAGGNSGVTGGVSSQGSTGQTRCM